MKPILSKTSNVSVNRFFKQRGSNPCPTSHTAERFDPLKKTPTHSRKFHEPESD
ncbi:hypothetical protein [Microcoleus sp. F4-D5]|uniref:hypothetical protein n=1 Tax=Microcoleus sp. F4-D5 TaxID=2818760 RepID=UPI002FD04CC0